MQRAFEVAAEHHGNLRVRVAATQQPVGELIDPISIVQAGDVVRGMCVEIEIAAESPMFNAD